jgi:hypothetical protein
MLEYRDAGAIVPIATALANQNPSRARTGTSTNLEKGTMAKKTAPSTIDQHFHHWKIDEPNGQVSVGVCKTCGETKQFKNWLSDGDFITNEEHRSAA